MNQTERIYKIEALLAGGAAVSFSRLQCALEVSRATLHRDLKNLRERYRAPIVWSRESGGYRYQPAHGDAAETHRLPALWFSPAEMHALLALHRLVAGSDPSGLLAGPDRQTLFRHTDTLKGATR